MTHNPARRAALKLAASAAAGALLTPALAANMLQPQPAPAPTTAKLATKPLFEISLAQWSLHRALFARTLNHLDIPRAAKRDYGISAIEYVSTFFKDHSDTHINELKARCDDEGVRSLLIMCDGLGALGDPSEPARLKTVENHRPWVIAAAALGCHSIRVNAESKGTLQEQERLAADGLRRLSEIGDEHNINIIVENHGGASSRGDWLAAVMREVNHPRCGTLPDFGNWSDYDRYQGVKDLMPFAKAVSAKSHDFDDAGNETRTDYRRMLKIVLAAGYRAHIGIEYEGSNLPEPEGIRATKRLLEDVRTELQNSGEVR